MVNRSTNTSFTEVSSIELAEVLLGENHQTRLRLLPQPVQHLVNDTINLAERAKMVAEGYQKLHLEIETLRAERDALAQQLSGTPRPFLN